AEIPHVARKNRVEVLEQIDAAAAGDRALLLRPANLRAELRRECLPELVRGARELEQHRDLIGANRPIGLVIVAVPQLDMRYAERLAQPGGSVEQRSARRRRIADAAGVVHVWHRHEEI